MIGLLGTQCVSTGVETKANFSLLKDFWTLSEKFHVVPLQVSQVSGTMMSE